MLYIGNYGNINEVEEDPDKLGWTFIQEHSSRVDKYRGSLCSKIDQMRSIL